MLGNPMNIPPVSIAAAKAALVEQYADPVLRRRATMLWGPRGVGKSSVVRRWRRTSRCPWSTCG
jgi:MoxR-like ATPase